MAEILKLLLVIAVIVFLIRKKWKLGYIMLLASLLLGVVFAINPIQIGQNIILTLIDPITLNLMGIIVLVYLLSGILREVESLGGLVDALQQIIKDYRLILVFVPASLGTIPMPAGAMFSAPLVKEIGDRFGLTPEEDTFVNYWFRHIWEFVSPLFPAMVLFAGLLEVEIREVILIQFPLSIMMVVIGLFWEYKNLKKDNTIINKKTILLNLRKLLFGVWPILFIIILVLWIKINLLFSLIIVIFSLFLLNIRKLTLIKIKEIFKNDIDMTILILIAGIMIFKRMFQVSGGIEIIPEIFAKLGIHFYIVLFIIPFFIGAMTGMNYVTLGISLPVLLPIIVQGEANLYYAMLAYTGSFIGVMISPMHLCLVVTKDYFNADMGKIYKMLMLPFLIIVFFALVLVIVKT